MDWQRETSLNLFLKHYTRTRFFRESTIDDPPYTAYERGFAKTRHNSARTEIHFIV